MEDKEIIQLFLDRDERAIAQTEKKYANYCRVVAYNILLNDEDAQECVNDAYLGAWNAIPPHIPDILPMFLAKLTRRIAIDKLRKNTAKKRSVPSPFPLDELEECLPSSGQPHEPIDAEALRDTIQEFLKSRPKTERDIFICRYFYCDPIADISVRFHYSQSKVKTTLFRSREKLKKHLIKEGFYHE